MKQSAIKDIWSNIDFQHLVYLDWPSNLLLSHSNLPHYALSISSDTLLPIQYWLLKIQIDPTYIYLIDIIQLLYNQFYQWYLDSLIKDWIIVIQWYSLLININDYIWFSSFIIHCISCFSLVFIWIDMTKSSLSFII